MNNKKMTESQKRLAEKNHNLIYSFMSKNRIPMDDYDVYALAYINAVMKYEEGNAAFSTYVWKALNNTRQNVIRDNKCAKRNAVVLSLDKEYDNGTDTFTLAETIEDSSSREISDIELSRMIEDFTDMLNENERRIFRMRYNNKTVKDIAASMGISRQRVNVIEQKIREKFLEFRNA